MRSGGVSLDNKRGVEVIRFANWSWLTLNVTFGNCLWNSSASAGTVGNPDSNTAFSSTGSVPQVGPAAAALADGAAALGGAALAAALAGVVVAADEGDDTVPGDAHAATMRVAIAAAARRAAGTEAIKPPCDRFLTMKLLLLVASLGVAQGIRRVLMHGPPSGAPWSRGPRARAPGSPLATRQIARRSRTAGSPRLGALTRRAAGGWS